jgi:hypothetical protein
LAKIGIFLLNHRHFENLAHIKKSFRTTIAKGILFNVIYLLFVSDEESSRRTYRKLAPPKMHGHFGQLVGAAIVF